MKKTVSLEFALMLCMVVSIFLVAVPAHAKLAIGTDDGWEFSTDGFINAFAVIEDSDTVNMAAGTTAVQGGLLENSENKSFRIRTGLLPGLLAFNIKAPTTNGIDVAARVGFYPQIQDENHTRGAFGSQIDLREAFLTADGSFGQILAGRALHLYQGKNILNDMTLFGAGVQGAVNGGATTLGYIGCGYIYTNFGAQLKYTTPDLSGFKIAFSLNDPSQIDGDAGNYTITEAPGYEGEISYAGKVGSADLQAWINGMSQKAENGTDSVTSSGIAAGVGVDVAGLHVLASGFSGKGNGSLIMMFNDAVDDGGEEREATGLLGQLTYTVMSATKIGIQYGETKFDETAADLADRTAGTAHIEKQSAYTLGIYHDLTPNFKVMAEYTKAKMEWFDGSDQESGIFAVGTYFIW